MNDDYGPEWALQKCLVSLRRLLEKLSADAEWALAVFLTVVAAAGRTLSLFAAVAWPTPPGRVELSTITAGEAPASFEIRDCSDIERRVLCWFYRGDSHAADDWPPRYKFPRHRLEFSDGSAWRIEELDFARGTMRAAWAPNPPIEIRIGLSGISPSCILRERLRGDGLRWVRG